MIDRPDVERFTNPLPQDYSLRFWDFIFTKAYGEDWGHLEVELLISTLHPEDVTELLLAKIRLLKVLETTPGRFYTDPVFMLHAMDIMNGDLPYKDLDSIPVVTSLELVYAITTMAYLYPYPDMSAVASVAKIILNDEGYTFVPTQLKDILSENDFPPNVFPEDSINKQVAIDKYLALMSSLDRFRED
jgi:hypothetical protein